MDSSISTDQIKNTLGSIFKLADSDDKKTSDSNTASTESTSLQKDGTAANTTVQKDVASAAVPNAPASVPEFEPAGENAASATTEHRTTGSATTGAAIAGQQDTTVEKDVAPAVEHEVRSEAHKEEETTVIEKERHQDHYHTTVQPLKEREVLPEQHDYEEKSKAVNINKDTGDAAAEADAQRAHFQNTSEQGATTTTKSSEAVVGGEHIHHHFHETIQPVIEKETIQPSVTHKTINVKETIQEQSENLGVTVAPTMSVDDFKAPSVVGAARTVERSHDGAPDKKDAEILNEA